MNIYFLFLLISFNVLALDARSDKLEKGELPQNVINSFSKTIPSLDIDQVRIMMPQARWKNYRLELLSGLQIEIINKTENSNIKNFNEALDFYKDINLTKKAFSVRDNTIYENDKILCKFIKKPSLVISDTYFECGFNYCTKHTLQKNKVRIENFSGMNRSWYDSNYKTCKYDPQIFVKSYDGIEVVTTLKISRFDNLKKIGTVSINDTDYFIDLNFCSRSAGTCKIEDKKISDFGKAFVNLKLTQQKKDYQELNYLIENLKPCVLKKDVDCIKRFFVTQQEVKQTSNYKFEYIPDVSNELIDSLNACLDYKSLLPYGGRLLDGKGNVCILDDRNNADVKIYSVTLPDAYKNNDRVLNVNYEIKRDSK